MSEEISAGVRAQLDAEAARLAGVSLLYLVRYAATNGWSDSEALTAAWLHGADHARRKARWPEPTDEAAEQLLRAMWEVGQDRLRTLGIALIDWGDREEPLREAAIEYAVAALRRLREQEGGEDGK